MSLKLQTLPEDYTAVFPLKCGKIEITQKDGIVSYRTWRDITVTE